MKVAEWIRRHPRTPATVPPDASVQDVLAKMLGDSGSDPRRDVYVVDAKGRPVGHIGFRRLAHALLAAHRPAHSLRQLVHHVAGTTASGMMETVFPQARPGEALDEVLHRQLDNDVEELLVVDDEHRPLGSIALLDVLRAVQKGDA